MRKIILFTALFLSLSTVSYSYENKDLKKVEQEISKHKEISSKLEKKAKKNEKELKEIQSKSIRVAKSLQKNESKIKGIQTELSDLSASIKIKEMQLEQNKEKSRAVLSSLMRISSIPTDGFVIASDNPQELINTRILLNSAMPYLTEKAKELQREIETIEESKQSVTDKKQKLTGLSKASKKEMKEIERLLKQKKKLRSKLTKDQKKEKAELKKLAQKASSMKDFLKRLKSRKTKPGVKPSRKYKTPEKKQYTAAEGNLPIVGRIKLSYGQKNPQDLTNKGWEIEGNANGLVTAPLDGEVLYSGEFGSYDNIVVFDNGGGYNLLLAGMGRIGVDVGDNVKAGEPVGFLKSSSAELYLEVRKNGNPINPKKVLK